MKVDIRDARARFRMGAVASLSALVLAISAGTADAAMEEDGYRYRSNCVGSADQPAGQIRATGVPKLLAPGLSYYVEWPSSTAWRTFQRIGSYNGGYWRAWASLQLNYEQTFGYCSE